MVWSKTCHLLGAKLMKALGSHLGMGRAKQEWPASLMACWWPASLVDQAGDVGMMSPSWEWTQTVHRLGVTLKLGDQSNLSLYAPAEFFARRLLLFPRFVLREIEPPRISLSPLSHVWFSIVQWTLRSFLNEKFYLAWWWRINTF